MTLPTPLKFFSNFLLDSLTNVIYSELEPLTQQLRKAKMNIQFDTRQLSPEEALGLISLLEIATLGGSGQPQSQSEAPPSNPTPAPSPAEPVSAGPALVQAQPSADTQPSADAPKRTRRTKAEMAADEAAKASSALPPATVVTAEPQAPAEAAKTEAASPSADRAPISADELRSGLNSYIARHSMEEAIAILQTFGCNRVSEALALDPQKLNSLVEKLRG